MKIHIDLQSLTPLDLTKTTELLWCIPFINDTAFNIITEHAGYWNHGVFNKLFYSGTTLIQNCSIEQCDFVGIPYKFDPNDYRILDKCKEASKYNKKVIAFYNDDNEMKFSLPENLILFRTSVGRSNITSSERIFPALVSDDNIFNTDCDSSIGFCGYLNGNRERVLQSVENIYKVNKIIRSGFWAPELPKFISKREYYSNLYNNKYIFCMRGAGNFSYRFYETLCFGRVPLLIDTDTILPLENIIDWDKYIVFIKPENINKLPYILEKSHFDLKENRKLWEEYFSPHGFIKNIKKYNIID